MKFFKSKKETPKPETRYIVYFNTPYLKASADTSFMYWGLTKRAEEYDTLEDAKESAKSNAKYWKCYITTVNPIYEYDSKITEFQV